MNAPETMEGFRDVTQAEFYAALYADPRDIMPTTERPDATMWRVRDNRALWGVSWPGWKQSGHASTPKRYALSAGGRE